MGTGASIESYPDKLNQAECEALVGAEAVHLPTFNQMCDKDGLVSKAEILALAEDDEEDLKQVAATVERNGIFFSFQCFDADNSGGLTYEEFAAAAKSLGYLILPENLEEECRQIDLDNSGVIDEVEFVKFIMNRMEKQTKPTNFKDLFPENTKISQPGLIYEYLGLTGAQHGYAAALAILKTRPNAAKDQLGGVGKGTPWLPLHYVLSQETPGPMCDAGIAAAKARRTVAAPLVKKLLKAFPGAAAQRIMEGVRYPLGYLPLELALVRGWEADVCKAIIDAYPKALTLLDPINKKTQKLVAKGEPINSLKNFRWMRQIANKANCDDQVMSFLPKPIISTNSSTKITWTSGVKAAAANIEKQEKFNEQKQRLAKRQERLQTKRAIEAQRRTKQQQSDTKMKAAQAKIEALLAKHDSAAHPTTSYAKTIEECCCVPSPDISVFVPAEAPAPAISIL